MANDNIFVHAGLVSPDDRQRLLCQKGCVVWLTGLSGSGKSTLAFAFERRLFDAGHLAYVLDGDNVRHGLNANLGFSHEDREENIRRVAEVAALFATAGLITITSFISPYTADREKARFVIGSHRFFEVHVRASLEVCESRDPKGLYKKARRGEIPSFTGVSDPYEQPLNPELTLDTAVDDVDICVDKLVRCLVEKGFLPGI